MTHLATREKAPRPFAGNGRVRRFLGALGVTTLLGCLGAANVIAAPQLGLELTRTDQPLHLGDERLSYQATVENQAGTRPQLGDLLTCTHPTPGGTPQPSVQYRWLREGTPIAGATANTYAVTSEDESKSIQCVAAASNDPSDLLPGAYTPLATTTISLPSVVVEPLPASLQPSGASAPTITGASRASTPEGTATITAGSKELTEVVSTKGTGTLTAGSAKVTGATANSGAFEFRQVITGPGIPEKTIITALVETAPGVFELTLSKAATSSGAAQPLSAGAKPFSSGQTISGLGIPPETKAICTTNQGSCPSDVKIIELSQPAAASGVNVPITGTSEEACNPPVGWSSDSAITWSFRWLRNGVPIPGATSATYTVQKADTEPPSILQCEAIAEDAEGQRASAVSGPKPTSPQVPSPYQPPGVGMPTIDFENQTSGEVELELEAPLEDHVVIFKALGLGWTCTKAPPHGGEPARAECTRSDPLAPGSSFPPLEVIVALGQTPPTTLVTKAEVSGGGALSAANAEDQYVVPLPRTPFGFRAFKARALDEFGIDYTRAGGHPFSAGAEIEFNAHRRPETDAMGNKEALNGTTRTVRTDPPRGFVGNPEAIEQPCPSIAAMINLSCPPGSAVGLISATTSLGSFQNSPIYTIEREVGLPAQFAFILGDFIFSLEPELRPEDGYAISLVAAPFTKFPEVFSADVVLCGFGVKEDPDDGCNSAGGANAFPVPFLTNPTNCGAGPPLTTIHADSWEQPGTFASASFESPPLTECDQVKFEPDIDIQPTVREADAPTGLEVELSMPTAGLTDPNGTAQANLKDATVTLPIGMSVNPSAANGLGACSLGEIGISPTGVPNDHPVTCPDSSKIGTVEARTPLLDETLGGTLFVARQGENPFSSLLATYLVIDSPRNGILVKLAGEVSAGPISGQLTARFAENPELPIESVKLHLRGGQRAPLTTPLSCGAYGSDREGIDATLAPWNGAASVLSTSGFVLDQGPGGSACPSGALEPRLAAGLADQQAGATSPFSLRLSRPDGTQRFRAVDVTMPPGLVAYLKGIPYCPDATLASVPLGQGTGAAQIAAPACPAASLIGNVVVGAGAGSSPLFVDTGRAYLAGPYKGAPLSLAVIAPAVAGPFDLGNVVVRTALRVDPETAQITAVSDPLPTILHGLLLNVREIRVNVDRPNFTVAPTNCEPMSVAAWVSGELGGVATATSRFQVGDCDKLRFKPKLKLRLHGKTRRGAYQRLSATLTYPKGAGYANIASAAVTFPRSIFLAQEHIRTICTRVQFAAEQCPKGSIYGKAKATSPLVDYALQGLAYLRSSSNPLPDLVIALKGPAHQPIEIDLVGRVDSKNGGIRTTFAQVPDAPVTRFKLEMRGGKKSLLVNSRNLCQGKQRAMARLNAQNGLARNFRPVVRNDCKRISSKRPKSKRP